MQSIITLQTRATLWKYLQHHYGISRQLFEYHLSARHIPRPTTQLSPDYPDLYYTEEEVQAIVAFFAGRERYQHVPKEKGRSVLPERPEVDQKPLNERSNVSIS